MRLQRTRIGVRLLHAGCLMQSPLILVDMLCQLARDGIDRDPLCYRHAMLPRYTEDVAAMQTPRLHSFTLQIQYRHCRAHLPFCQGCEALERVRAGWSGCGMQA